MPPPFFVWFSQLPGSNQLFRKVPLCKYLNGYSQFVYTIKADSTKLTNDSCTNELIIENHTKNVCGFLFNTGNGRTEFRTGMTSLGGNKFLIGCDTLDLSGIGGTSVLSALTAATATNTINNAGYAQVWQWNSLAGASAFKLSSTSTAAASNAQKLLHIDLSGANSTSAQTSYGSYITNTHTGTSSTNIAGYFSASGGTNNYAAIFANGYVGIGTGSPAAMLHVTGNITSPGVSSGSEKFGLGAIGDSLNATAIGNLSLAKFFGTALGHNSESSGSYSTALGANSLASGGYSTAVGRGATSTATYGTALGYSSSVLHNGSIVIGNNLVSTANYQILIGSGIGGWGATDLIVGSGVSSVYANSYGGLRFKTSNGSGTNNNGEDLKIAGGSGTGSANGGYISFLTTPSGSSGTTLNTEVERLRITPGGKIGIGITSVVII